MDAAFFLSGRLYQIDTSRHDIELGRHHSTYGVYMLKFFKQFHRDQDGAVTVDWVVLTAAIVALGLIVLNSISSGATGLAADIGADMTASVTP